MTSCNISDEMAHQGRVQDVSTSTSSSLSSLSLSILPSDLWVSVFGYLRAVDLSGMSCTCKYMAENKELIEQSIRYIANEVYGPELTDGWEYKPRNDNGRSSRGYAPLYHLELLVIARILSRPEPSYKHLTANHPDDHGAARPYFVVSKSWIKTALKWLEVVTAETNHAYSNSSSNSNKHSRKGKKKGQRRREKKRLAMLERPGVDINSDLRCPHGQFLNSRSQQQHHHHHQQQQQQQERRGNRRSWRMMEEGNWHVLKKFYPHSTEMINHATAGCPMCLAEQQAAIQLSRQQEHQRRLPLTCPIVRRFYNRRKGLPTQHLLPNTTMLQPGTYHAIPRSWCRNWRTYIKTGHHPNQTHNNNNNNNRLPPPDSSLLLCDGHKLPLVPPHLESYLYGETTTLYEALDGQDLDRNNKVVVEVLSDQEYQALTQFWPSSHHYALSFSILQSTHNHNHTTTTTNHNNNTNHSNNTNHRVQWTTKPCRSCDNRFIPNKWKNYASR